MKKSLFWAIVITIAMGLVITSTATSVSIIKTNSENNDIVAQYLSVQGQPIPKEYINKVTQPLSFAGVNVTGGNFDEFHGSVAGAPGGEYYAMAEYSSDGFVWHPMMFISYDGLYWEALVEFLYDNAEFTDFDQNGHGTYGTFGAPPTDDGLIAVLQGEISDGWIWNFGDDNIREFVNNRIDCYTFEGPAGDPGTWNWGGLTLTGYNGWGTNDIEGCPFIFYQYSDAGGGIIGWLTGAGAAGCWHVGSAMDLVTNMHYAVYDRNAGESFDLLIRKDDFGAWTYNSQNDFWTHNLKFSKSISDTANLMYPSAAAYNDNVVIACQKDDDVVVYYSLNGMLSYTEVFVQDLASYPEVAIAAGGTVVLTYIKDNLLYLRTSNNGGASWSAAEVVSDNQVNLNDRAANLDEYGGNIIGVWEDTRDANINIYYDLIFEAQNDAPEAPYVNGPNEGVPETLYDYDFSAVDPNGDKVRLYINWGDGGPFWTGFIDSGSLITLNHSWAERGEYTITVRAQDFYGEDGPESSFSVTIPRNRGVTNTFFLQFFQRFPNAFPILRQLLNLG